MRGRWIWILLPALILSACTKESNAPAKTGRAADPKRGRGIYLANCISCHNNDPSKDGPIGPGISGASQELIETRLLHASYPPGYTPKRNTKMMPAMPYLKNAIPDLVAFLTPGKKDGIS